MNSHSATPTTIGSAGNLRARIAELRRQGTADLLAELQAGHPGDDATWTEELGALLGLPARKLHELVAWTPDFTALPFAEAARRRCAVFSVDASAAGAKSFEFVATDPFDTDLLAWARSRFGALTAHWASPATFDAWLSQAEQAMTALEGMGNSTSSNNQEPGIPGEGGFIETLSLRHLQEGSSPAVRFVNSTLYDALKAGASDIHLESDPLGMTVKFRIDGVLTAVRRLDGGGPDVALAQQAVSRIKVMAQLDIAERRVPQDGRLQIQYASPGGDAPGAQRTIDVRVSIMPSIHGEDAVLRILDRQHLAQTLAGLTLEKLGFDGEARQALKLLCRKPHGMFLVTGPTGSGKTTTLYAAITETHESRDKVITIEDPVEYQLPGVLQIPVNERKGLSFARGLRSILRHDPDKILVGEIRDAETAQIAVQSALTGHLVFTTVHANTVFDVVGRFEQFGIDAYTFASAINGVLAQRLVRRLCPHCARPVGSTADQVHRLQADPEFRQACDDNHIDAEASPRLLQARGCERCRGTGYSGRFALGELLTLTPQAKALIARKAPQMEIQAEAERAGWRSLRRQALAAALRGWTTMDEVDRVAA